MSSLTLLHPEEGILLQYLDGELGRRQSRGVHKHLEACWQCRASMEDLQTTVNDCVRYRKQVLIATLPEAPQPWGALDFARVDSELATESFSARLGRWFSPRQSTPLRWVLSGAMAIALMGVVVFRDTPRAEAAALLRKAVEISEARPQPAHRLRVLSSRGPLTRSVRTGAQPSAAELEVARWFTAARYDWSDPLSAKAYAAWRDALSAKVDEVSTADPAVYSIKTTTANSELISATLKLRKTDFAPVSGRFEFRNGEWVELTESVDQLEIPASTVAGATGGTPRQPGVPPGPSSTEPSAGDVTEAPAVNEELQVVAALHQLGADLGDPLEVTREGRQVVVTGAGISVQRQQQIHNQLDRLPHVVLRFTDPTFPASQPASVDPATSRDAAVPERSTHPARIEQRLGGRPQFERFSGQVLDWTDSAMSRAYALRRLSQQFPVSSEGAMRAEDRRTLRNLGREHVAALQKDLARIQTTVNPVLTGIGAAAAPREARSAVAWQDASEQVLASARKVETLLAVVLGVTPSASNGDAPSQLLTALGQLTSEVEQCQRLLSYD
jgi:hypothetical protein